MPLPDEVESSYYAAQGFDPAHARAVLAHYLPYVETRSFLVDLGCGRGELLDLARDRVGRVLGVDVDPAMVAAVRDQGIDAVQQDVLAWVAETDETPDAVFMAHLVEHLTVDAAYDLLVGLARVIPPGGVLIVVTPNPACMANLRNDFWSDPTHLRLYTPDLLSFLLDQAGFEVTAARVNPENDPGPPPEFLAPPVNEDIDVATVTVEPAAPIQYDESFQLETLLEETARLRAAVLSLVHGFAQLEGHHRQLRHLTSLLAERHDATLRHLWEPNEIYVVGERRR